MEIWKTVPFNSNYAVSSNGQVKRIGKNRYCRSNIILKPILCTWGYYVVSLSLNSLAQTYLVHRLVLETFSGKDEFKSECNHKDGNKLNNKLENLEWVTHRENMLHAAKNGLMPDYSHGVYDTAKLHDGEVWLIKKLLTCSNLSNRKIAKMFKISHTTINKIALNKTKHYQYIGA